MQKIVWEVLGQIPRYIIVFFSTLGSPKKYPLKKLKDDKVELESKLTQALSFLLISYALVILLNAIHYDSENLYSQLASNGLSVFVYIALLIWAIYFAWRIVGSKLNFYNYLIIYSYHFGIAVFIFALIYKISDGILISLDPELYENLLKVHDGEIPFDNAWFENSVYVAALLVIVVGFIALTVWNLVGWGAYRIMNESSRWKSVGVLFLAGLISWPIHFINYFIQQALNVN